MKKEAQQQQGRLMVTREETPALLVPEASPIPIFSSYVVCFLILPPVISLLLRLDYSLAYLFLSLQKFHPCH